MDLITIENRIKELEKELDNTIPGSEDARRIIEEIDQLRQIRLREMKFLGERKDARAEKLSRFMGHVVDGAKTVIGVVGGCGAIVLVMAIEEKTILGQKLLNMALKILPKVV